MDQQGDGELLLTPTNVRVVINAVAQAALVAAGIGVPFYDDKTLAQAVDPSVGYIDVDWTGVGRQGPLATGLESGILGPTFRAWTPRNAGDGLGTEIAGVLQRAFRSQPHLPAPAGDVGEIFYRSAVPAQELGMDDRQLYRVDTTVLFNHYDPA